MSPGDKYLEMTLDLLAKAAHETNAVRRAGLEALAESYRHGRAGKRAHNR